MFLCKRCNNALSFLLQASNLLYVDQPIGTGFSYSADRRDIRHSEDGVSNDLYDFLQVCHLAFIAKIMNFSSIVTEFLVPKPLNY